jgi:hypothetical protein
MLHCLSIALQCHPQLTKPVPSTRITSPFPAVSHLTLYVSVPVKKTASTRVTFALWRKLALEFATSGGRLLGTVRLRTKGLGVDGLPMMAITVQTRAASVYRDLV